MSRRSKKLSRAEALAILSTAPVQRVAAPQGRETLKSFTAQFDAEEKQRAEAPIKTAQTEHSRLLKQLIDGDLATLYSAESKFLAATAPNIGNGDQFNNIPPEAIKATIRRVFSEFEGSIATTGKLTASGKQKMQSLARANLNCDATQVAFWTQAFYLLRAAGELTTEDFVETPAQQPEAQPSDLLSALDAQPDTRDGARRAKELANEHFFSVECREVYDRFLAHCARVWDFYPTEQQARAMVQWFQDTNRSMIADKTAWDDMRRSLVSREIFPRVSPTGKSMLTDDELLAERIESSNFTGKDAFSARKEFAQESRRINGR